jgi:hypothetical protein
MHTELEWLLRAAGVGQIALGILAHPLGARWMGWGKELAILRPLSARIFRALFFYISAINVAMGALGLFAPQLLLQPDALSRLVCAFIAAYWAGRLGLQLFYYRWHEAPPPLGGLAARMVLTAGFMWFAGAHAAALWWSLAQSL